MKYWGYCTREEYLKRFQEAFPPRACPEVDDFFSVPKSDITRQIIESDIPVGLSNVTRNNLYSICDEYMTISTHGMAWLLPEMCKYVLMRKACHDQYVEFIPLYIGLSDKKYNFDLDSLNHSQKDLLYNFLEYVSEEYDLHVSFAQDKLNKEQDG